MARQSTVFFCTNCGNEFPKWMGQCPSCKEWNTISEEPVTKSPSKGLTQRGENGMAPVSLRCIKTDDSVRIPTRFDELDRVLGGGIVPHSLILVGGDPGIGKSTLLLQVMKTLSDDKHSVLYISGEESLHQIRLRADRIGEFTDDMQLLCETDLNHIEDVIKKHKPEVVVIDSIQTMYDDAISAAPGSVSQVREATNRLMMLAKGLGVTIFIVGHVTKEGTVAGPRVLEHMVDTVLYFEGDRHASYRILRGVKNRFGSTNEIGVFEMTEEGLKEVLNPSEFMLSGRPLGASGCIVSCSLEGTRPLLVEIQALCVRTAFGMPRRQCTGFDVNRTNLLLAVLEKRLSVTLSDSDAYINITGGIRVTEPAIDLGVALAVLSGVYEIPVRPDIFVFGEIGLSGEVRSVSLPKQRVLEARKLGFSRCIVPKVCMDQLKGIEGIRIEGVSSVKEASDLLFKKTK